MKDDAPRQALPDLVFHVLLALGEGPSHGYAIGKDVEEQSEGRLDPGSDVLGVQLLMDLKALRGSGVVESDQPLVGRNLDGAQDRPDGELPQEIAIAEAGPDPIDRHDRDLGHGAQDRSATLADARDEQMIRDRTLLSRKARGSHENDGACPAQLLKRDRR